MQDRNIEASGKNGKEVIQTDSHTRSGLKAWFLKVEIMIALPSIIRKLRKGVVMGIPDSGTNSLFHNTLLKSAQVYGALHRQYWCKVNTADGRRWFNSSGADCHVTISCI